MSLAFTDSSALRSLINIEHERPSTSKSFRTFLKRKYFDQRRRASISSPLSIDGKTTNVSLPIHAKSVTITEIENDDEQNSFPLRTANKFLQELRAKRREFQLKSKNLSIDQRIELNRRKSPGPLRPAQDLFDVHFHRDSDDEDFSPDINENLYTEESQEKLRTDIYNELNRQRIKQYRKEIQNRFLARFLFLFVFMLLSLMSGTLIYGVMHLLHRADQFNVTVSQNDSLLISHMATPTSIVPSH